MSERSPSCVLLADRHHGLAEGVRKLLQTRFETVIMVADEASLSEAAYRVQPDVMVVDLSLVQGRGLGWLTSIRERSPGARLVLLSVHDEEAVRRAALDGGADAYVLKTELATDLLPAIARACAAAVAP